MIGEDQDSPLPALGNVLPTVDLHTVQHPEQ